MSVISSMLRQTAVYWAPVRVGAEGQPSWADPVELRCRWEQGASESHTADEETVAPDSTVYVSALDGGVGVDGGDVKVKGMLLLGPLTSSMTSDARTFGGQEIVHFTKVPDFKARHYIRTASVRRS